MNEEDYTIVFNEEKNVFEIFLKSEELLLFCKPRITVCKEYNPSDFIIYSLVNHGACEENIFCVKCNDSERVGWIFPAQALVSIDHSYADNIHFQKQAYIAYYLIINSHIDDIIEKGEDIFIEDYFEDDLQFLLLEKPLLINNKIENFTLDDYLPSFLEYGYFINGDIVHKYALNQIQKNIRIGRISHEFDNNPYIITLFKKLIPTNMDSLSRFHILYQAIEVMIAIVFEKDFKNFLEGLSENGGLDYLNEKEEKLKGLLNEKRRIQAILDENKGYTKVNPTKKANLKQACIELCKKYSYPIDDNPTLVSAIYGVRCFLVHNAYKLDINNLEELSELEEINHYFLDVLVDMVDTFRYAGEEGKIV